MALTGRLRTWASVDDGSWRSLLVGNGSSIAVWPRFAYGSLLDRARCRQMTAASSRPSVPRTSRTFCALYISLG
jgi:hypothetical protein